MFCGRKKTERNNNKKPQTLTRNNFNICYAFMCVHCRRMVYWHFGIDCNAIMSSQKTRVLQQEKKPQKQHHTRKSTTRSWTTLKMKFNRIARLLRRRGKPKLVAVAALSAFFLWIKCIFILLFQKIWLCIFSSFGCVVLFEFCVGSTDTHTHTPMKSRAVTNYTQWHIGKQYILSMCVCATKRSFMTMRHMIISIKLLHDI